MQVRVVAATHPLCGQSLCATAFRRLNGVLHLVVRLPDGSPGTIPAAATSVWGELSQTGSAVVLDVEGLRLLRQRVQQVTATRRKIAERLRTAK
jgi:hypothetical protein